MVAGMIKLKGLSQQQINELIPHGVILLGYRGSVAHGTYTPSYGPDEHDDKDIMGVMIPGLEHYFGLTQKEHHEKMVVGQDGVTWDSVVYEIRKYVHLLLKSNPNVLSLLWLPEHLYIYTSDAGRKLIDNRDIFVTKQAYHAFVGYAHGQLHRMTHVNTSDLGAKRKWLIEQCGYDCKNASHLIRLLRMGIEFLTDGELQVVRSDATELKEIKNGEWPLRRVLKEANRLFEIAQEAYIRSSLPPKPDRKKAERLIMEILSSYHRCSVTKDIWGLMRQVCRFQYINKRGQSMCRFYGFAPCRVDVCPMLFGDKDEVKDRLNRDVRSPLDG